MIWQQNPMICQGVFHHFGSIQTQDRELTIRISSFDSLSSLQSYQLPGNAQVLTDGRGGELLYAPWRPYITPRPVWNPEWVTECSLISFDMQHVGYYTIKARKNSIVCLREITPNKSILEKTVIISALFKASTLKFPKCIAGLLKRPHWQFECLLIYNLDRGKSLKGYSGFKNPFSRLSFFGFKIIFDHMRVHIPNIGSLAHS